MKKVFYIFFMVFITIILIVNSAEQKVPGPPTDTTTATSELQKSMQNALYSGESFSGIVDSPITLKSASGKDITVQGEVEISNNKVTAGQVKLNKGDMEDVTGLETKKDGYTADSVNTLNQDGNTISEGSGIELKNLPDSTNQLTANNLKSIKTKNNLNFKDIKGGTFLFNQLGDLESAKFKSSNTQTKNNLNLKDENGNNIVDFNIIDNNKESSIDIEKQSDGSYKITTSNLESTFHGNGFNEYVFGEKSVIA